MKAKPRALVACPLPTAGLDLLSTCFVIEVGDRRPDRTWLLEHVPGVAAIVTDPSVRVDSALLDAAGPSLKVVSNFGVGFDNIDLDAVRARGVRATNTPDVLTGTTAELAVALMLAAGRRLAEADALARGGQWPDTLLGRELIGSTVGVVGFGRIGRRVAELLRGFDVRLLFTTRSDQPAPGGAERRELSDLLASSDFVSLHVPLTADTRHLIDSTALQRMKRGAILVNTSRGAVVDTGALVAALRSGRLGAVGLDVYENEPHIPAELRELPNTVLLPHIGSATAMARDAMARLCAQNALTAVEGREPPAALV